MRRILSLYDRSGHMLEPWRDAGWACTVVDIEETRSAGMHAIRADLATWKPSGRYDFVVGFPPCTDLAVSGARWFAEKGPERRQSALMLFDRVFEIARVVQARGVIAENPVSVLATERRPPDYTFHPWHYAGYPGGEGDTYPKLTCLWAEGRFRMPPLRAKSPTDNRIHMCPPGPQRAYLRSLTPRGFARAVFEANEPWLVGRTEPPPLQMSLFQNHKTPPERG